MGEWGAADPADARNRRTRCSILVEDQGKTVLVDTSPDVRAQLLDARVEKVDAVIWTHEHADQVHGIDDLRPYTFRTGAIEAWADRRTLGILKRRFDYVFATESIYHALYRVREIEGPFTAAGAVAVTPIPLDHGSIPSLGFRFGDIVYANDVVRVPERGVSADAGCRCADRRCHALPAASDARPSRSGAGMDRADRAGARFSHQSPRRHGLC